jgi:hypothetical protein
MFLLHTYKSRHAELVSASHLSFKDAEINSALR